MTDTLAPPTPNPSTPSPPARRPATIVALAAVAVIALGVVAVAAIASNNHSAPVSTMMGRSGVGPYNMPYGMTGTMMGGGSMMGGNYGATSPAVAGAREIAITAKAFAFTPNQVHVKAGETVTIALTATDLPHDFTIDTLWVQVAATAGETVRGALRSPTTPGTCSFCCSVPATAGRHDRLPCRRPRQLDEEANMMATRGYTMDKGST